MTGIRSGAARAWLAACILVIASVAVLPGCGGRQGAPSQPATQPGGQPPGQPPQTGGAPGLSEQPDEATFEAFFSDLYIGLLPPGQTIGPGVQVTRTTTFKTNDLYVLGGTVIKEVQLQARFYDVAAGGFIEGMSPIPPMPMAPGGFAGSNVMTLPAGRYELKCYAGDKLVAVLPFTVE